jgi:hypothetical protein
MSAWILWVAIAVAGGFVGGVLAVALVALAWLFAPRARTPTVE